MKLPIPNAIKHLSSTEFQTLRKCADEAGEFYSLDHFGFPQCTFPIDKHKAIYNRSVCQDIYETLALSACNQPISYAQLLREIKFFPCFSYDAHLFQINYGDYFSWSEQERGAIQHFLSDTLRAIHWVISTRSDDPVADYLPAAMAFFKRRPTHQEIVGPLPLSCIIPLDDILLDFAADFDRLLPLSP